MQGQKKSIDKSVVKVSKIDIKFFLMPGMQ
jgi:hypothetical protein